MPSIRPLFCLSRFRCTRYYPTRKLFSSLPPPNPRIVRLTERLPRRLQGYLNPLLQAPLTHITSFLLLHELTAIVPLFALAGAFHYTNWLPPYISEGKWVSVGVEKFGSWFRKKGWLGGETMGEDGKIGSGKRGLWWGRGETGVRVVVEFATAYAIVKALLPLRLMISVSSTPWFARVAVIPTMSLIKKTLGRGKYALQSRGAGPLSTRSVAKQGPKSGPLNQRKDSNQSATSPKTPP